MRKRVEMVGAMRPVVVGGVGGSIGRRAPLPGVPMLVLVLVLALALAVLALAALVQVVLLPGKPQPQSRCRHGERLAHSALGGACACTRARARGALLVVRIAGTVIVVEVGLLAKPCSLVGPTALARLNGIVAALVAVLLAARAPWTSFVALLFLWRGRV